MVLRRPRRMNKKGEIAPADREARLLQKWILRESVNPGVAASPAIDPRLEALAGMLRTVLVKEVAA